jgi:DNA-binding MarR family transcriptional regulator
VKKKLWVKLRDQTLTQRLLKAARIYNEMSIKLIRHRYDLPNLRVSHTTLLPHIDFEGTRQTEIAKRMGVTKQAVGQLIDEMVEMGSLKLEPDPKDGRAKLVKFDFSGALTPAAALDVAADMENRVAQKLGEKKIKQLKQLLLETIEALE